MAAEKEYTGNIDPSDPEWENSPWTKLLVERYQIASLLCKNKNVLDSCCGTAWGTINFIAPTAHKVTAFDMCLPASPKREVEGLNLLQMDATKMTIEENFDIVLALDSIEHFSESDADKYLTGIKRALKKEGLLIGSTPLIPDKDLIKVYLSQNKYHLHMFLKDDLRKKLGKFFANVKIFEIYNITCPYFFFLCSDAGTGLKKENLSVIRSFITKHRKRTIRSKIIHNFLWAKYMALELHPLKSIRFLFRSSLHCFEMLCALITSPEKHPAPN
jgi:SAM-dependent methyltransferase